MRKCAAFLFEHLNDSGLLNTDQSGFRYGDSFVYQLLTITDDIYKAFDRNSSLEVKGVFLDLSTVFERV